jgi:hypothetical protein
MNKPDGDGVDHINIYSQGKTILGRFLSNWARSPIDMDEHGHFESVEGYWYWLGTHDERFRSLYGYAAKQLGREVPKTIILDHNKFKEKIELAIQRKIAHNPPMLRVFIESTLPFTHYYVYSGMVKEAGYEWIVEHIELLRTQMHADALDDGYKFKTKEAI